MPLVLYLASPAEIAEVMNASAGGRGETVLESIINGALGLPEVVRLTVFRKNGSLRQNEHKICLRDTDSKNRKVL